MAKLDIDKDPEALAGKINRISDKKLILGLDFGTTTGYSYGFVDPNDPIDSVDIITGQLNLSAGPYDSGAIRFVRLRQFLSVFKPDLVIYEDVKYTPPAAAGVKFSVSAILARAATSTELFGAFKATASTWCEEHNVACHGIGIGQIKKRATGRGNANKEDVITACNEQFGTAFDISDYKITGVDNIADSAWVFQLGYEQYAKGL